MTKEVVKLDHAMLEGADFSRRKFEQFTAIASSFRRCSFKSTRMDQACFGGGTSASEYIDCSFDGSKIQSIAPGVARFVRCSFRDCVIREFYGRMAEMVDCVFSGRIEGAVFYGSVPDEHRTKIGRTKNDFYGNDFSGASLLDVAFRDGIDLSRQVLPTGPSYLYLPRAAEAVAEVKQSVIRWKDLELRRKALAILQDLEMDVDGGQQQLFIDQRAIPSGLREASEVIFDALRNSSFAPA